MDDIRLVYITCETRAEALIMSRAIVEERLAACTNVLGPMTSTYRWEGQVETAEEVVVIAKTTQAKARDLARWIQDRHSYDVPCALSLPVRPEESTQEFMDWLRASVD